jgi:phosphoribosylamine--glycine ligase
VVTPDVFERVMTTIMRPTVDGMAADGHPYTGFLYAGLMIDSEGTPRVIEFNCRFGDPETQPIMMRLQSSLVELVQAGLAGELPSHAEWDSRPALGIVLAAEGYPNDIRKGDMISGLGNSPEDSKIFHAGTSRTADGHVITNGGRVLCVTALGDTVLEAQTTALEACGHVHFHGMQYRSDIGYRAIARDKTKV